MVVTARAEEGGARHREVQLEADDVAVKPDGGSEVADVQVHVTDGEAGRCRRRRLRLVRNEAEEAADVERIRAAAGEDRIGPLLPRPVGRKLDPVPVRVGQVDRLVRAVVGRSIDRRPRQREPLGGSRELEARGMEEAEVVEPRVPSGRTASSLFTKEISSSPVMPAGLFAQSRQRYGGSIAH